jgi:hypothetical protein
VIAFAKAADNFPESHIVNFDQSNGRLGMASEQIVGERGAEIVHDCTDGDAQTNFSFFASLWPTERSFRSS